MLTDFPKRIAYIIPTYKHASKVIIPAHFLSTSFLRLISSSSVFICPLGISIRNRSKPPHLCSPFFSSSYSITSGGVCKSCKYSRHTAWVFTLSQLDISPSSLSPTVLSLRRLKMHCNLCQLKSFFFLFLQSCCSIPSSWISLLTIRMICKLCEPDHLDW